MIARHGNGVGRASDILRVMTESRQPDGRRRSFWRRRPIITAGIGLIALAAVAIGLVTYRLLGPEPPIVVSPETTRITEPLAADGLPDYARHALMLAGRGTPPDENAAVPLLEAFWPMDLDDGDLTAVCADVGIAKRDRPPSTFKGDDFFVSNTEVNAAIESLIDSLRLAPPDVIAEDVIEAAMAHPWRSADLPPLSTWLETNAWGLDLVVEASKRPHLYLPAPALLAGERGRLLFDTPLPLKPIHSSARGLILRSMQRTGDGRFADAWSDLLAVHRLARLAPRADAGSLIGHLTATALSATACEATLRLLDAPRLPADFPAAVGRDLDALTSLPEPRRCIVTQRLGMLDIMIHMKPMPRQERAKVLGMLECTDPAVERTFGMSLDWNAMLRDTIAAYARLDTALGETTWAQRQQALTGVNRDLAAAVAVPAGAVPGTLHAITIVTSRTSRSRRIAAVLSSMNVPAARSIDATITRGRAVFELTRIAAALAACRVDDTAGGYPKQLDQIVPRYLDRVPLDPFTDRPFRYERRGDGYLLSSVGQDGRDDGGNDLTQPIVGGEWVSDWTRPEKTTGTDVVVRLPMPPSPVLARIRGAKETAGETPAVRP
jgi:hypothetical protein